MSDSGAPAGDDEVGLPKATVFKLIQGELRVKSSRSLPLLPDHVSFLTRSLLMGTDWSEHILTIQRCYHQIWPARRMPKR